MKLSELFRKLSFGELSALSLSGEGSGSIQAKSYGKVISAINVALIDLHTRNILIEKELMVQSLDWKSKYELHKQYAKMDSTTGVLKYILDTPSNPFTGDLVRILRVSNEVGAELPLNDSQQWASVFTPRNDVLQLTHPGASQVFFVGYQALHPEILDSMDTDVLLLAQEITIPPIFEAALCIKVASVIYAAMSGQDYGTKAQALEMSYESKLVEIEQKNLNGDAGLDTNVKIYRRGFP